MRPILSCLDRTVAANMDIESKSPFSPYRADGKLVGSGIQHLHCEIAGMLISATIGSMDSFAWLRGRRSPLAKQSYLNLQVQRALKPRDLTTRRQIVSEVQRVGNG